MSPPRIAVIGGGVTGLAAAYELRNNAAVTIFEATDRLGGKVLTEELDGIQVEVGPDSLLARDDTPIRLLHDLGLGNDIVEPTDFGAWIAVDGTLERLPEGFVLGIPASPMAILRSGLLSPAGIARASLDLVRPRTRFDDDISVGALIRTRFGNELAERVVAPLMAGVRSGSIDEMSLDLAAPQVAEIARRHRSLTLGLAGAQRSARPRFIGLRRGMISLVDRLAQASGARIQTGVAVTDVGTRPVSVNGEPYDGAVIAAPPYVASRLLKVPPLADTSFAWTAVVNLVYPPGGISPPERGTGILVPPDDPDIAMSACTWFTKKWPHLAPPDGRHVVRCVFGGEPGDDALFDDWIIELMSENVASLVQTTSSPIAARVHRWERALPRFEVGHRSKMTTIIDALEGPVRVAGAGYLATGINDCLAHGRAAAREVLQICRA